jgi:predicted CoA-binding protein
MIMAGKKKTLVLGASENPARYSYLAIQRLRAHQHPVLAVGKRTGHVADVPISKEKLEDEEVDTVTLYLNPLNQVPYYDYIMGLHPKRIIFNPGTENDELIKMAKEKKIEPVMGCTLVMLSTGQY